jgi:hypothetical protein
MWLSLSPKRKKNHPRHFTKQTRFNTGIDCRGTGRVGDEKEEEKTTTDI